MSRRLVLWLGAASLGCHVAVACLSFRFVVGAAEGYARRPILWVLTLLGGAFACYLILMWRLRQAARKEERPIRSVGERSSFLFPPSSFGPLGWILVFAVAFRVVHLLGDPIQEVDIYRYLWDGQVCAAGVNPYRYSPNDAAREAGYRPVRVRIGEEDGDKEAWREEWIWSAGPRSPDGDRLLKALADPAVFEIFWTVDHRDVRTIYPPAAQGMFQLAAQLTPKDSSVRGRIRVMKLVLMAFDLGVIGLVMLILRVGGMPLEWCAAYAWCPLVLKEVANSGHVDVLAVFFTVLCACLLTGGEAKDGRGKRWKGNGRAMAAGAAYAAAILSKVYPLVLLPLLLRRCWELGRWRLALLMPATTAVLLAMTYAAVWPAREGAEDARAVGTRTPFSGLQIFLAEWEMNDLIFNKVHLGLDRILGDGAQKAVIEHFAEAWPRRVATAEVAHRLAVPPAFLLAYLICGLALGLLILWFAIRRSPAWFLEGLFYSAAVLFLLGPTANPWYLLWAVPFLPWARQFAWCLLTGLVLQYYLRFWFDYHFPDGSALNGREFFDEVWLWVEYTPFLGVLMIEVARATGRLRLHGLRLDDTKTPGTLHSPPEGGRSR